VDSGVTQGRTPPACPLCGCLDGEALGATANGPLLRCAECSLTYHAELVGAPAGEVEPYYGDDEAYEAYRQRKQGQWQDLFARLRRYVPQPGARLLDVGCARGYSVAVARGRGFDAWGIEPSEADARYGREVLGVPVRAGTVERAAFPADHFDAVVLWSVLEHLADARATMAAIARILRPGGVLNIFTPNGASRAAREQGLAWAEYHRPGHAALFSPVTVGRLLEGHGLRPLEIYTTLWAAAPSGATGAAGAGRSALMRLIMRPGLAPLRRRMRRVLAALAPQAAADGEYMGVYARKKWLDERGQEKEGRGC